MTLTLKAHYDAIIIGSGAGGSAVAYRLATAGKRVLMVERGKELKPQAPVDPQAIGHYLYDEVAQGESAAKFLGGQTKFYGAALYRMRESDFVATEHEMGTSPAWPFPYAALEPYYAEAEKLYKVHGDAGSDPTEPPRSAPLPHTALPHSPTVAPFIERLIQSGTVVSAIPRGIDYGDGGKCVLCPTCDAYYCQLDAKMDAENSTLRPAVRTGNVDVALGADCLKIVTSDDGTHATGVVLSIDGQDHSVSGDHIVVGAGIPGSMTLLWKSRTDKHPAGLGNNTGNLGKHLGGHSTGMVFPVISAQSLKPVPANHTKTFSINAFYDGAPDWKYPLGVIQAAGQMPYWRTASKVMKLPAWLVAQTSLTCFYMIEAVPSQDSGYAVMADGIGEKVEPPLAKQTFAKARSNAIALFKKAGYPAVAKGQSFWHETGTVVIGNDPATSVCNADCEVHDVKNLYVVDASALPTAGAVNTCLTIVAVALKAADAILAKAA